MIEPPLKVLVVDDEPIARGMAAYALQQAGFQCDVATDGAQARESARSETYDAVVTDLCMPNQNGHALSINLLERSPRPVIVILTGVTEPKIVKDLVARGVDDVLFKPVDYGLLAATVRVLVKQRASKTSQAGALADISHPIEQQPSSIDATPTEESGSTSRQQDHVDQLQQWSDPADHETVPVAAGMEEQPTITRAVEDSRRITAPIPDTNPLPQISPLHRKLLAVAIALPLGLFTIWLVMQLHIARQQARTIAAINALGAHVARLDSGGLHVDLRSGDFVAGLQRLRDLANVESIVLDGSRVTDDDLEYLTELAQLSSLSLRATGITDGAVNHLKRFDNLRDLDLQDTEMTQQGIDELRLALPQTSIEHGQLN